MLNFASKMHMSTKLKQIITKAQEGQRIDHILQSVMQKNWNQVHRVIRNGEITLNDSKLFDYAQRLQEGDIISLWQGHIGQSSVKPTPIISQAAYNRFKEMIIYENDNLMVINKPCDFASQGGSNSSTNIPSLAKLYAKQVFIVHRLDQYASGLLVIAKQPTIASRFGTLFEEKQNIKKEYYTIVQGIPKANQGIINTPLVFNQNKMKTYLAYNEQVEAKSATTQYDLDGIIKYKGEEYAVLKVVINEGRKHQIRAHLSQGLGTPVLFDQKYGFKYSDVNRELYQNLFVESQGILLHSHKMTLINQFDLITDSKQTEIGSTEYKSGTLFMKANLTTQFQTVLQLK